MLTLSCMQGDICYRYLWPLDQLEAIAPLLAAKGDEDYQNILEDKRVKEKYRLSIEGINLSLIHEIENDGFPSKQILNYRLVESELFSKVTSVWTRGINGVIVFGHRHKPIIDFRDGSLFINPGSPTQPDHDLRVGKL